MSDSQSAYRDGFYAYSNGKSRWQNPYRGAKARNWWAGWRDAYNAAHRVNAGDAIFI